MFRTLSLILSNIQEGFVQQFRFYLICCVHQKHLFCSWYYTTLYLSCILDICQGVYNQLVCLITCSCWVVNYEPTGTPLLGSFTYNTRYFCLFKGCCRAANRRQKWRPIMYRVLAVNYWGNNKNNVLFHINLGYLASVYSEHNLKIYWY